MKLHYIFLFTALVTFGAARGYADEGARFVSTNVVNLASIRSILTTNLTIKLANIQLGETRIVGQVHGSLYQQWTLDDGSILFTAFELLPPGTLLYA